MWKSLYYTKLLTRTRYYVEGNSLTEHRLRLATAYSMDGRCWRTNVRTSNVTESPLSDPRNQGVAEIRERLVIGSHSFRNNKILTATQECVICGSVYVDGQNLGNLGHSVTQPRANLTGGRAAISESNAERDQDIRTLDLPNPVELKNNVTIPPAAIHPTVRRGVPYSSKQLNVCAECSTQQSTSNAGRLTVSTCIRHSPHSPSYPHSPRGLPSAHSFTQALDQVRFMYFISGYFPLGMFLREIAPTLAGRQPSNQLSECCKPACKLWPTTSTFRFLQGRPLTLGPSASKQKQSKRLQWLYLAFDWLANPSVPPREAQHTSG